MFVLRLVVPVRARQIRHRGEPGRCGRLGQKPWKRWSEVGASGLRGDQFDQLPGRDDACSTPRGGEMLDVAGDQIVGFGCLGAFQKAIVSVISRDSQRGRWLKQSWATAKRSGVVKMSMRDIDGEIRRNRREKEKKGRSR